MSAPDGRRQACQVLSAAHWAHHVAGGVTWNPRDPSSRCQAGDREAGATEPYFASLVSEKSPIHTVPVRPPTLKTIQLLAAIAFARNSCW